MFFVFCVDPAGFSYQQVLRLLRHLCGSADKLRSLDCGAPAQSMKNRDFFSGHSAGSHSSGQDHRSATKGVNVFLSKNKSGSTFTLCMLRKRGQAIPLCHLLKYLIPRPKGEQRKGAVVQFLTAVLHIVCSWETRKRDSRGVPLRCKSTQSSSN